MPLVFDQNGNAAKLRQGKAKNSGCSTDQAKDPEALAKIIRDLQARVRDLEAGAQPDFLEYTVNMTASKDIQLVHNLKGPVRWWIADWADAIADATVTSWPKLRRIQAKCTPDLLYLSNGAAPPTAGILTIRIQPSQSGTTYEK